MSRKSLQGSSLHIPQSFRPFLLTEQSYRGQVFEGIDCMAQNVEPLTLRHPSQLFSKNSQSLHISPQVDMFIAISFLKDNNYFEIKTLS